LDSLRNITGDDNQGFFECRVADFDNRSMTVRFDPFGTMNDKQTITF